MGEIKEILDDLGSDAFYFSGGINFHTAEALRTTILRKKDRRDRVSLFMSTPGGDPHASFRMMRALQSLYGHITIAVSGLCKSAGTLAAIGAHEVAMGARGEFGPLDVQLSKPDEIALSSSGLDIMQAVSILSNEAFDAFEESMIKIIQRSGGGISTKTAAEIAQGLAVGVFAPMSNKVDPERLGEISRAMMIARHYGERLNAGNLKDKALDKLIANYPDHGSVIDFKEAKELFTNVRAISKEERRIIALSNLFIDLYLPREQNKELIGDFDDIELPEELEEECNANEDGPGVQGDGATSETGDSAQSGHDEEDDSDNTASPSEGDPKPRKRNSRKPKQS